MNIKQIKQFHSELSEAIKEHEGAERQLKIINTATDDACIKLDIRPNVANCEALLLSLGGYDTIAETILHALAEKLAALMEEKELQIKRLMMTAPQFYIEAISNDNIPF